MSDSITEIIQRLRTILPEGGSYPLHEPTLNESEKEHIIDCLDSGWVSSVGPYVDSFEQALADYTSAKHATVTMNGTAALHICLLLAGVKPEDEVLVPTLTFVATANAIAYCHATPHFVDCESQTLGVCPDKLRSYLEAHTSLQGSNLIHEKTGKKISALVVTHIFGHPAQIIALKKLCDDFHITLIEDAAEAMGSFYQEQHLGTFGALSAVSFNGNKIMTTGGGGAILTNDPELAQKAKHLTTTAKTYTPTEMIHDQVGYNYRMPNINAAMGIAQLKKLPEHVVLKRQLAERYREAFSGLNSLRFFTEPKEAKSNYWLNTILVESKAAKFDLLNALQEQNIMARPAWHPLHLLPMYRNCPHMNLDNSLELYDQIINLPSSPTLMEAA